MDGYFHNYQLMGDDFMLSLAKIDLGYKFTKGIFAKKVSILLQSNIYFFSQIHKRPHCALEIAFLASLSKP